MKTFRWLLPCISLCMPFVTFGLRCAGPGPLWEKTGSENYVVVKVIEALPEIHENGYVHTVKLVESKNVTVPGEMFEIAVHGGNSWPAVPGTEKPVALEKQQYYIFRNNQTQINERAVFGTRSDCGYAQLVPVPSWIKRVKLKLLFWAFTYPAIALGMCIIIVLSCAGSVWHWLKRKRNT